MNKQYLIALLVLAFGFTIQAQTVTIDYLNPDGFTVCDIATFEVTVNNNLSNTLENATLEVDFPAGISYEVMSITNGVETDITNLNVPVFGLPAISPNTSLTLTFNGITDCSLVDAINSGALFENDISVNYPGGNQSVTTLPYTIETPLILITSQTGAAQTGTKGDILTRTFTFTNTRIGALTELTFIDTHQGGIEVTTDLGTIVNTTPNSLEILLGSADFMTIGDGDGLFELNEVMTITETILITDCGYEQAASNSILSLQWGCNNEICQTETISAVVNFIPSTDNPNLTFIPNASIPTDFCGNSTTPQSLTITNAGSQMASNVLVNLDHYEGPDFDISAIDPNTLFIDSAGVNLAHGIQYSENGNQAANCTGAGIPATFNNAAIILDYLGPGETITIYWETYSCFVDCGTIIPNWTYEYEYLRFCPENDTISGGGGSNGDVPVYLIDSLTYYIGEPLMDDMIYDMNYLVNSPLLTDSSGLLVVEFILPCGLSWVENNDMILGGVAPTITTIPSGDNTIIRLEYPMPMPLDEMDSDLQLEFNCEPECVIKQPCELELYTTCPPDQICGAVPAPTEPPLILEVNTSILFDPTIQPECGWRECQEVELIYDCPVDPICYDTIFGHFVPEMEFVRTSLGTADDNNDQFEDAPITPNLNLIRQDRAIPSDTMRTTVRSVVETDIPGSTFENANITIQFEAHTADDGIDGGQVIDFEAHKLLMTQDFGIMDIDTRMRIIDASTGESYACNLQNPFVQDTLYAEISVVNTRPPEIIDQILYMNYTWDLSPAALNAMGCDVPADFRFALGDSVIVEARHQVLFNCVNGNTPFVTNLRTTSAVRLFNGEDPGDHPDFACACPITPWQLSGYKYEVLPGQYAMDPCAPFDSPGGQQFSFRLGWGNFFPFEFRHLGKVTKWDMTVPPFINLLDSELEYLRFQDGATIYQNQVLNPTASGNTTYAFDLNSYQMPLLDEGFEFALYHEFDVECTEPFGGGLSIDATIDFADNLLENPNVLDTIFEFGGGFFPLRPNLIANANTTSFVSFGNIAMWDFTLTNASSETSINSWLIASSVSGGIDNFQLINTDTGLPVPIENGIFQLGDISAGQSVNYQLIATNNSCDTEFVNILYGWNCDPYTNSNTQACDQRFYTFSASSPLAELEMDIDSPIGPHDLCDEIPYHTVEVFNAQLGSAFNIDLEATLPAGLSIVPGSIQFEYPTGSGWNNLPDPADLMGTIEWDIATINSTIGTGGLSGFQFSPDNSFSIRFLTTTECGFVAGTPIIFNVEGTQNCPTPTNELTRAGLPIQITGVIPPYTSEVGITVDGDPTVSCGGDLTFMVGMTADGTIMNEDSILITLPLGATYVTGSFSPGTNAPSGEPNITIVNGLQVLAWGVPSGTAAGQFISFEITTTNFGLDGCEAQTILAQAVQSQEAVCVTTGELCEVLAETGSATLDVSTEYADLDLEDFSLTGNNYNINIENTGTVPTNGTVNIDFYLDNDGDGLPSPGDTFLGSDVYSGIISAGGIGNLSGNIDVEYEQICSVIAVVDSENNCICASDVATLDGLSAVPAPFEVCSGAEVEIGIPTLAGHIYSWSPANDLTCADCPMPTFEGMTNNTSGTITVNYVLTDDFGNGCAIQNLVSVDILPMPQILSSDTTICAGEVVTLVATEGETFNWEGEGITEPNMQSQTVSPDETTTYTVSIVDNIGCEGMGNVTVNIEGEIAYTEENYIVCPGEEIEIFGEMVSAVGSYCDTIVNLQDCDAVHCINLENFITETEDRYQICQGDTLEINDTIYFAPTEICETMLSSDGCDSTHCFVVEVLPIPEITVVTQTTFLVGEGEEVQLEVDEGYAEYEWFPTEGLSCTDCHNPIANPAETTEYMVMVTDTAGCSASITFRVARCIIGEKAIPSAFSPNGDGLNDIFTYQLPFDDIEVEGTMRVYNRWGQLMYEDAGVNVGWDGMFKGKPAPTDVYVYIISVECTTNEEPFRGDVTLLR